MRHRNTYSKRWKASYKFPGIGNYSLRVTCKTVEKALDEYETELNHRMKTLVVPKDWKISAELEDASAISSILFRSLELYFNYLIDVSVYSRRRVPYISHGDAAEIDELRFPQPQIISDKHNPSEYYTRLSRAILHMFMYSGLTICRCEMDVERNTSLVLFSIFDWFGFIQPGLSTTKMIDSVHVFKRSAHPQWTKDGFVPIVFLPQRLQTINEDRFIACALQNQDPDEFQFPKALIPLASAVEQTLETLLVYAINDWKRKRTQDQEIFILPEWLFIHGIVYDALWFQSYALVPKILECDTDGVPSKWEFLCVPMQGFDLFEDLFFYLRANRVSVLLAMQRHIRRICQILDGLDPVFSTPLVSTTPELAEESRLSEIVQCTYDETVVDEKNQIATRCLLDCIRRTGLGNLSRWSANSELANALQTNYVQRDAIAVDWLFEDTFSSIGAIPILDSQKSFLVELINNWQFQSPAKIYLPEEWFTLAEKKESDGQRPHFMIPNLPKLVLQTWTSGLQDAIVQLTPEELQKRHSDP